MAPVSLFTHESVSDLDSLDERFTFHDKNLWFSEYEKQRSLTFENFMNIARYRSSPHIGDLAIAYTALRKALEMVPDHEEAGALLTKTTVDLNLPDADLRQSQLEKLRVMYEKSPDVDSSVFSYLNALVKYYRLENSIVNPQQMDDAVELMKKSILNFPGMEEQFLYMLAMILTGAGRHAEAAGAFEGLLKFHPPDGTGSSMLSKNELIYNIAESYYNAGSLTKAEEYLERLKPVGGDNSHNLVMQRKIAWKKSGYK
jgi:tetratricopeptide (TPR) repeat protein